MTRKEVEDGVVDSVSRVLGVKRDEVTMVAELSTDLGADSLDIVEVSIAVEDHFKLTDQINDEEMIQTKTIQDVVNLVCSKLGVA